MGGDRLAGACGDPDRAGAVGAARRGWIARRRALLAGIALLLAALVAIWLPLHGFGATLNVIDGDGGSRTFELTVATSFLALLALAAVIGFAVRYRAHGEWTATSSAALDVPTSA